MTRTLSATLACTVAVLALPLLAWGAPCGNVTYTGCCSGTTAKYCKSGTLVTKDCTKDKTYGPNCGWVAKLKYYTCNKTVTTDPSGKNVRDCTKLPDAGTPKKDSGTPKKDSGTGPSCGTIKSQGCCDGNKVKYCASGKLNTKTCTGAKPKCGWDSTKKYYTCGTTGKVDPAGKYPMKCSGSTSKDSGTTKKDTGTTKQDTGSTSKQDTGSSSKQDTGSSTQPDTGTTGGGDKDDEGCSCAVNGQPGCGALLLLMLGMLLLWRRQRG